MFYTTKSLFKNDERFIIQKETGSSSWFAFTMIVNPKKIDRLKIFKKFKKNKIDFRMITGGNIASHDVIKHLNISKADLNLPNANYIHRNGFFIGNHPRLIEKELKYLKKTLEEV